MSAEFGNPSSVHRAGQRARMAVDEARETIATCIGARPSEIVFTSGGTESNTAALRGVLRPKTQYASEFQRGISHALSTAIEHESVLEPLSDMRSDQLALTLIEPDGDGLIDPRDAASALRPETRLVSVMMANNEVGTLQPVQAIGELCGQHDIVFHVDAVQATGSVPVNVDRIGCDLLSISAHKFYGPKGVGALFVREGTPWRAQQLGGGQERLRRSGTENVAGIVGMAAALDWCLDHLETTSAKINEMSRWLIAEVESRVRGVRINGSQARRLPGNVNLSFQGISGESLVLALDAQGIMASTGSACSSGSTDPSHVLLAMGRSEAEAGEALRLTLGAETSWDDIRGTTLALIDTVNRLRPPSA